MKNDHGGIIDLTGQRFGMLTVMHRGEDRVLKSGARRIMWHCKCDCGNEVDVMAINLKSKHTSSCGCARKKAGDRRRENLTGERFGHLIAIKHVDGRKWLFKCDCGRETVAFAFHVKSGKTQTCGKDCSLKKYPDRCATRRKKSKKVD